MSKIIVLGAGVCGLAAGMLLAGDGHQVTIVERDGAPPPDTPQQAWDSWTRSGVNQFRQAHFLLPAGRAILDQELPQVAQALAAAGAARVDLLSVMPPAITDRRHGRATTGSSPSLPGARCWSRRSPGARRARQGLTSAAACLSPA